jgi:hypothetical protein
VHAQAAGEAGSSGGDLVLDAGTGFANGVVRVGPTASGMLAGSGASVTTSVMSALLANSVSVTGVVRAASVLSLGAMTAGGVLSAAGGLQTTVLTSAALTSTGAATVAGVSSNAPVSATAASLTGTARSVLRR